MKWLVAALVIWGTWWLLRKPVAPRLSRLAAARRTLGVGRDADAADIRTAHRRLIAQIHPDRGGSAELTREANAARDLLLARLRDDA